MKNPKNSLDFNNYLATDFATNKNKWWKWCEKFSKQYYLEMAKKADKLIEIFETLEKIETPSELDLKKANRIANYLILSQAIKINDQKEVSLDEEIMKEFVKIKNKKEADSIKIAVHTLNEELKLENESDQNLDDLFKNVISFYKDEEVRKSFFTNILNHQEQDWNFNEVPLKNNINFVNNLF